MKGTKTLLEIVYMDFARAGNTGPLTKEFVVAWRKAHPAYEREPLWARFYSGSALAILGNTTLDRVTAAWLAAGNPRFDSPGYTNEAWEAFCDTYTDEYLELEPERQKNFLGLYSDGTGMFLRRSKT